MEQSALAKKEGHKFGRSLAYSITIGDKYTQLRGVHGAALTECKSFLGVPASSTGGDWTRNKATVNTVLGYFQDRIPARLKQLADRYPSDAIKTALKTEAAFRQAEESFASTLNLAIEASTEGKDWPDLNS